MGQLAGGRLYASLPEENDFALADRTNLAFAAPQQLQQPGKSAQAAAGKARQLPASAARSGVWGGGRGDATPDVTDTGRAGSEAGSTAQGHRDSPAQALASARAEWLDAIGSAGANALPPRPATAQGLAGPPLSESMLAQRTRTGQLSAGTAPVAKRNGRLTAAEVLRSHRAPADKAALPLPALAQGATATVSEFMRRAEKEAKRGVEDSSDSDLEGSQSQGSASLSGGAR